MKKRTFNFFAILAVVLTLIILAIGLFSTRSVFASSSNLTSTIRCNFDGASESDVNISNGLVDGGKLTLNAGGKISTVKQTKFFSAFIGGITCDKLQVVFGKLTVTVDAKSNKIIVTENSVDTEYADIREIDYSEYSVYIEVLNGECDSTIVNDEHVITQTNGKVTVGIVGKNDAIERVYESVVEYELTEFSYSILSVVNGSSSLSSIDEIKIFPLETGYDIPTRNYDPQDEVVNYTKKPVQLTEKQLRQRNAVIIICSVSGCVVVSTGVILTVILVKKRRGDKNEK